MENFRIQFENIDKVTPNDTEIGGDFDYFSKNCILCFTNLCFYLENGHQESYRVKTKSKKWFYQHHMKKKDLENRQSHPKTPIKCRGTLSTPSSFSKFQKNWQSNLDYESLVSERSENSETSWILSFFPLLRPTLRGVLFSMILIDLIFWDLKWRIF